MCGINGIFLKGNKHSSAQLVSCVEKMNKVILHRGPDENGIYAYNNNTSNAVIGMQRLSIIDLHSGKQPIIDESKGLSIVFNGEIYNFIELRKKLIDQYAVVFETATDTEVVLRLYQFFGAKVVDYLNGMFSFIIIDKPNNKIFAARDRMGEKPFYIFKNSQSLFISSELKSIVTAVKDLSYPSLTISKQAVNLYFALTYIPAPFSIYEEVTKLLPGHYIEMDLEEHDLVIKKYWDISYNKDNIEHDYKKAQSIIRDLLFDSVEKRMIADVPLGSFLSGGVDSSIITAIMAKIKPNDKVKTFSVISNNKSFDESDRSNMVAKHLNTEHFPILLDFEELKNDYEKVILNYDEPFGDSSALPTYFVSKKTKEYVTVALTGDGGDEVFGGYNRYLMPFYGSKYRSVVPSFLHNNVIKKVVNALPQTKDDRGKLFRAKKLVNAIGSSVTDDIVNIMKMGFQNEETSNLLNDSFSNHFPSSLFDEYQSDSAEFSILAKSRFMDKQISLEGDMLVKVDRASMLTSLECRPPLLDHRLMEYSFLLPDSFMIKGNDLKFILKDTFKDLLPDGLFDFPKSGFGVPVGNWLRDHLKNDLLQLSNTAFLLEQSIFKVEYIQQLIKEHLSQSNDHTFKLWSFFCFQKWWINHFHEA